MTDRKVRKGILVSKSDQDLRSWWTNLWKSHGFENWSDARGWLWDEYRAEVSSTHEGFRISFMYDEDFVLFLLSMEVGANRKDYHHA